MSMAQQYGDLTPETTHLDGKYKIGKHDPHDERRWFIMSFRDGSCIEYIKMEEQNENRSTGK